MKEILQASEECYNEEHIKPKRQKEITMIVKSKEEAIEKVKELDLPDYIKEQIIKSL